MRNIRNMFVPAKVAREKLRIPASQRWSWERLEPFLPCIAITRATRTERLYPISYINELAAALQGREAREATPETVRAFNSTTNGRSLLASLPGLLNEVFDIYPSLSTSDMTTLFGIALRTLFYWNKQGIVTPEHVDSSSRGGNHDLAYPTGSLRAIVRWVLP